MGNVIERRLRALSEAARRSADAAADDREARNTALADADAQGWGLREIARASGMSVAHVQRVVLAAAADRQSAS
jgi:AraC-like DNA-binding protein